QLKNIAQKLNKPQNFHLKIDTGMRRQGILETEIDEASKLLSQNKNIILEGVCSHFADADGRAEFTYLQIEKWNNIAKSFRQKFPSIKYFHLSNTAGNFYSHRIDANVSRLGVGLYGINTSYNDKLDLRPALEMKSIISSLKNIGAGEKVGYGITFESSGPMKIATVPAGYNEGVDRRLSGRGMMKIGNNFCAIIGRVSMNMSTIDVSGAEGVKLEDEVIVVSSKKGDKNCVEQMAKMCECTAYEILVHIPKDLRRVVI